jgi:hypothetical protein
MPESEEQSVPSPSSQEKFLVRAANGDLWVVQKNATPVIVHTADPNDPHPHPDPQLVGILAGADEAVTRHFDQSGSQSLASGVKIRMADLF